MTNPISDASRRMMRAQSADGLAELAVGIAFLLLAASGFAKEAFDPRSRAWQVLNVSTIAILFPGIFVLQWALPRLRNRLFGDREGTMIPRAEPQRGGRSAAVAIVAAMTAVVLVIAVKRAEGTVAPYAVLSMGFVFAIWLALLGRQTGVSRYPAMGAAIAAASVAIALRAADLESAYLELFGVTGVVCLFTGVLTLWRYLHTPPQHPSPAS